MQDIFLDLRSGRENQNPNTPPRLEAAIAMVIGVLVDFKKKNKGGGIWVIQMIYILEKIDKCKAISNLKKMGNQNL